MKSPFERIAIVNRGEAAIRLIRAVQELNREQHLSLATVALFTETDRQALFVREADDAICIGPATFVDQRDGQPKGVAHDESGLYRYRERIEEALVAAYASAVWVGWGPQAREFWLADLCERRGIAFVGPDAHVLRLLGNRNRARQLAQRANIPVVPPGDRGIEVAHRLEVQMIADQYGTIWATDVRNCTTFASRPDGARRI